MVEDKNNQIYNLTDKYKGVWTVYDSEGKEIKFSMVFEESNKV